MKIGIDKEHRQNLEAERDKRLMRVVSIAMNEPLKSTPCTHAKSLHKHVAEYAEICALLDATYPIFHPCPDGYNEP